MQKNKRVIHHDCCATCMMHQEDTDTDGADFWFCLEDDCDDDGYRELQYYHDDKDQFKLKFFMVCDLYAQPPTSQQVKAAVKAHKEQEQS